PAAAFDRPRAPLGTLTRSVPYGLPATTRPTDEGDTPAEQADSGAPGARQPDLTHFAALEPARIRITGGRMPAAPSATAAGTAVEAALPEAAAGRLGLEPGARLRLTDRLGGPAVDVRITGVYRPVDATAAYWQLDDL